MVVAVMIQISLAVCLLSAAVILMVKGKKETRTCMHKLCHKSDDGFLGQSCLRTNSENGLPRLQDYQDTDLNSALLPYHHQAIIPSYKFNCHGNITEWRVAISGHDTVYTLNLQSLETIACC